MHLISSTFKAHADSAIERGWEEIIADLKDGTIPSTITTFADLHDHVDANLYGDWDSIDGLGSEEWVAVGNYVQNGLDLKIKASPLFA